MSKVALETLIENLEKSIRDDVGKKHEETAIKAFRRTNTNRYANAFRIRKKDFRDQVLDQIRLSKTVKPLQAGDTIAVRMLCDKYYDKIAGTLITRSKNNPKLELIVGPDEVTIISYEKRELTNFDAITQQTIGSKAVLRNTILQPFLQELNALLTRINRGSLSDSFTKEFNLGHTEGSNVQYYLASQVQSALDSTVGQDEALREIVIQDLDIAFQDAGFVPIRENERSVLIEAQSKFHNKKLGDLGKTITLTIESRIANQNKQEDKDLRRALINSVRDFVVKRPASEWLNQESSDSMVKAVYKSLYQTAIKEGAKGNNPDLMRPIDASSGKASRQIKQIDKDIAKVTKAQVNLKLGKVNNTPQATPSYLSIINLINARLPPKVRSNMGSPRLNNRTGRLSESARVTSITPTPQGLPSIEYTYQRSPYDVFDKTVGKKPWATLARDPSNLIAMSVRELAQELGMKRFYTRRAK